MSGEGIGARAAFVGVVALTSAAIALVPGSAVAGFPGRNGLIAFHDDLEGGIYTIRADGAKRRYLGPGFEPAFSPSGRRIAYVASPPSDPGGDTELYTMRPDGKKRKRLTFDKKNQWEPEFSPNGRRIIYRIGKFRSGPGILFVHKLKDGTRAEMGPGTNPDWSVPAGRAKKGLIAFDYAPAPSPCFATEIFTALPGRSSRALLQFGCDVAADPSWHPKALRLVFATYATPENLDIVSGLPDGSSGSEVQLSDLAGDDVAPDWSPDGKKIVFSNGDHGAGGLYIVRHATPLAELSIPRTAAVNASAPSWQPR